MWRISGSLSVARDACYEFVAKNRYSLSKPGRLRTQSAATAKASYQEFLTLWKDADPDIPILKEAKAEYAKLQ
jgi:hypothetical protein